MSAGQFADYDLCQLMMAASWQPLVIEQHHPIVVPVAGAARAGRTGGPRPLPPVPRNREGISPELGRERSKMAGVLVRL